MTITPKLTSARIYWDMQDPNNEGWAYNLYYDNDHEESGPFDWIDPANDNESDLEDGMVELLSQNDIEIHSGDVAVFSENGRGAEWTRPEED